MQFQNWGEDKFIEHLSLLFPSKDQLLGIGDDCAVIPTQNGIAWLVTTDALVEGVHFIKDQVGAKALGYKTIAVNISDIAAMGGEPKYAFLSIALPKTIECIWVRDFLEGVKEACDQWSVALLGGDTVGSKRDIFLNITLVGSALQDKIKYRDKAEVGDLICVSGYLGDSGAGLKALQEKTKETEEIRHLINAHFRPQPSPQQGIWLAAHEDVNAMMDISDGLDCDLKRLIKKSRKGAEIETKLIPISRSLATVTTKEGWDVLQLALTGGEDYCLLFTVAEESFENLKDTFNKMFHCSLFQIGKINDHTDELIYYKDGKKIQVDYDNYSHF